MVIYYLVISHDQTYFNRYKLFDNIQNLFVDPMPVNQQHLGGAVETFF